MKLSGILRRAVPFLLTLLVGIASTLLLFTKPTPLPDSVQGSGSASGFGTGSGSGSGNGYGSDHEHSGAPRVTQPLRITAKPKAAYTDEARANDTEGTVRLKVTLLASGQVGSVTVVNGLPDGLTEQAIEAARRLEFTPAMVNGVPVAKTITIDYSFTIY